MTLVDVDDLTEVYVFIAVSQPGADAAGKHGVI